MSTRSLVGIQNRSGKSIRFIYVHFDGYIGGVGLTLIDHFKTRQKTFRLISNGDASSIGSRINPRKNRIHNFDTRQNDVCCFYKRDRGETGCDSKIAATVESFAKKDFGAQYFYYLDNDSVWWVSTGGEFIKLKNHKDIKNILKSRAPKISFKINEKAMIKTVNKKKKVIDEDNDLLQVLGRLQHRFLDTK